MQMFCVADPPYDKSLQQLQSFLNGLVTEEKLEFRDEMYFLKKWSTDKISIPFIWFKGGGLGMH